MNDWMNEGMNVSVMYVQALYQELDSCSAHLQRIQNKRLGITEDVDSKVRHWLTDLIGWL
jgi:hypothetical protein